MKNKWIIKLFCIITEKKIYITLYGEPQLLILFSTVQPGGNQLAELLGEASP